MPKFVTERLDHVRICYKHFSGSADDFHNEGQRDFSIIIEDPELYDHLAANGWPVKSRPGREEGDPPFMTLPVKVKYGKDDSMAWINPTVILQTGSKMVKLDADTIAILDSVDIEDITMDIRAYDWSKNGRSGRSAELHGMKVTQRLDRFGAEYDEYLRANSGSPDEDAPF